MHRLDSALSFLQSGAQATAYRSHLLVGELSFNKVVKMISFPSRGIQEWIVGDCWLPSALISNVATSFALPTSSKSSLPSYTTFFHEDIKLLLSSPWGAELHVARACELFLVIAMRSASSPPSHGCKSSSSSSPWLFFP